jgi:hypothetical protein
MLPILLNALLFGLIWPATLALPQPAPGSPSTTAAPETLPTASQSEIDRNKYFHEPGGHEPGEDDRLGHYDTRYFHGLVSLEERTDTLTHMVRAYLTTFQKLGLETWIAHGTLLGWWWNGKVGNRRWQPFNTSLTQSPDSTMGLGCRYPSFRRNPSVHG